METWQTVLQYDPIPYLLAGNDEAVRYFTEHDLLDKKTAQPDFPRLAEVQRLLKKQRPDGAWEPAAANRKRDTVVNYRLIETWKKFRCLSGQYELNSSYPAVARAAEFLFSCQTRAGDFRGFLGNQYAMYYTGALLALLVKAGYAEDSRVEQGFRWLLAMRQDDGGWVESPHITLGNRFSWAEISDLTSRDVPTLEEFDRTKPFSITATGMILRAFAAHSRYRRSPAARQAAGLLKARFFKENNYSSYKHPDYWLVFQFPFWWNNLVSALDTLSWLGFTRDDESIGRALDWLRSHQLTDGAWEISYSRIHKSTTNKGTASARLWITLVICRILRRFY